MVVENFSHFKHEMLSERNSPENELASLNGLWKVWDSGKTRYVMPLTSP